MNLVLELRREAEYFINYGIDTSITFIPFLLIAMVIPRIMIFIFDKEEDGSGFGVFGWFLFRMFGRRT